MVVFDPKTLQVSMRVDTAANPDAIVYEPKNKEVYALNHTGKSVTVINADTGAVTATIPLSGTAESGAADPQLGRVYVNIENTGAVDVIDIATHKVIANWKVAPAEEPTGMAIDLAKHRLFIGGGPNQVMLDGNTGKVIASADLRLPRRSTRTSMSMSSCSDGHIDHQDCRRQMTVAQTRTNPARGRWRWIRRRIRFTLRPRTWRRPQPGRTGRRADSFRVRVCAG